MLSLIEVNGKKKLKLCTRVQRNKEKAIDLNKSFSIGLLNIYTNRNLIQVIILHSFTFILHSVAYLC